MMNRFPLPDPNNQGEKIAIALNAGVSVATTDLPSEVLEQQLSMGWLQQALRWAGRMLSTPTTPSPVAQETDTTLFLPYGKKAVVCLLPVKIARGNLVRFCPMKGAKSMGTFPGSTRRFHYDPRGKIHVFTRTLLQGLREDEYREAVVQICGDDRELEATIEELRPYTHTAN